MKQEHRLRGLVALELRQRWQAAERGLLYLAAGEREAEYLGASIHALFPELPVMVLPRWDCLPYDPNGPSREVMGRRASVLRRLAGHETSPPLVIATAEAVLQRVPPRSVWAGATLMLRAGQPLSVDDLRSFLEETGYALDALVDQPGEAAIHGQVLDVFPGGALGPVRIELAEGRIAAINAYDPVSQRIIGSLPEVVIDAASELIGSVPEGDATPWLSQCYGQLDTVFDYVPKVLLLAAPGIWDRASSWLEQSAEHYQSAMAMQSTGALPTPDRLYLTRTEWEEVGAAAKTPFMPSACAMGIPYFALDRHPNHGYREFIVKQTASGHRVLLTAADSRDLKSMTRRAGTPATAAESWAEVLNAPPGSVLTLRLDLEAGFVLPVARVTVITGGDLLGSRTRHVVPMALPRDPDALATEIGLHVGEPVVHLDHGICLLRGIESIGEPGGTVQDTIRLEFAGAATLMVPVQDIASIWAYGASAEGVSLDRLNSEAWANRKAQVELEITETARNFAALKKQREACEAPKLVPPARAYERFAAGFLYDLTPDQAKAVEEILDDMRSGRPMDRLLSGDVGFGKTEVALRAVAAAVLGGKQAAVMVPTTVLARQHFDTFRRRFAPFGVDVQLLSRVGSATDHRAVKQGLRDGSVQVVVGTHAVAGKDLRFKNLALVVIDEEQRFGARIKDRVRAFARGLHLLMMSATPIPRTLQRAIVGLQSYSALETPPARRLPVRTVLTNFEAALVRNALAYERRRGGQSFVVCPRIEDLEPMAARLRAIMPQLAIASVHGRMAADQIDQTFVGFAEGRGDILLTTNIIETGLDIPRANTILIWRPDRFGAAQLHQLRGRVGRGRHRGLAYLLTDPAVKLSETSRKRLQGVAELDRLGAGFAISRRDLDLRGAGDLLGEAQAGHIKSIGVELYRHLLELALNARPAPAPAEVNLGIPATITADYIAAPAARINLYARLARMHDLSRLDDLVEEIEERFGPMPPQVANLVGIKRIAETAAALGISRIDAGPHGIALRTNRHVRGHKWRRSGDRYIVPKATEPDGRIALVWRLLEEDCLTWAG
jgi:transcription-repair coupling factor (superfamily II helicase)